MPRTEFRLQIYSSFVIRHSLFVIQPSTLNIQHPTINTQYGKFDNSNSTKGTPNYRAIVSRGVTQTLTLNKHSKNSLKLFA